MRRILFVLSVALVVAAMMVAMAAPAFAGHQGNRGMEHCPGQAFAKSLPSGCGAFPTA